MAKLKAREGHEAEVRREGVERLAAAVRALGDAVADTGVDRATLDEVTGALELMTHRLRTETDDDAYSGLVIKPVDYSIPEGPMPLNPILGACSPVRPDAQLRFRDGEIAGTASFTRRFVGPPGFAHGGISAMLADQIVAASPGAIGAARSPSRWSCSTSVRCRSTRRSSCGACACRPARQFKARCTITPRGKLAVEGSADLVSVENFYARGITTKESTVRRARAVSGVSKPVGR